MKKYFKIIITPGDPQFFQNPTEAELEPEAIVRFTTSHGAKIARICGVTYVGLYTYLLRGYILQLNTETHRFEAVYIPFSKKGIIHIHKI